MTAENKKMKNALRHNCQPHIRSTKRSRFDIKMRIAKFDILARTMDGMCGWFRVPGFRTDEEARLRAIRKMRRPKLQNI